MNAFRDINTKECYEKIIKMGDKLPSLEEKQKISTNLVPGCQSRTYLYAKFSSKKVIFFADSDSLISRGLSYILIFLYNEEHPKTIITRSPEVLKKSGFYNILSPSRGFGLESIYRQMQRICINKLTCKDTLTH